MKQLTKKVATEVNKNLPSSVTELNTLTRTYSIELKQCNKNSFETRLKELTDILTAKLTPTPTPTPKKKGTWATQVIEPNKELKIAEKTFNSVIRTAIDNHENERKCLECIEQYKLLKLMFIPKNKTESNFDYYGKMKSEIVMKPIKNFPINYTRFEMLKATRRLLVDSKFVAQINKDYKG
ncbi:MAG: hypothetical protein ACYS5F_13540 [Planctomycetota bacterium]|jgi:hypothetical protein